LVGEKKNKLAQKMTRGEREIKSHHFEKYFHIQTRKKDVIDDGYLISRSCQLNRYFIFKYTDTDEKTKGIIDFRNFSSDCLALYSLLYLTYSSDDESHSAKSSFHFLLQP